MISTCGSPPALLARDRGFDDRLRLHAVEAGLDDAEPTPPRAEHRVRLAPLLRGGEEHAAFGVELALARRCTSSSSTSGRNSCSGGSSSRMVTGRPSIASKMPSKSERCSFSSSSSAAFSSASVGGEDEPLHERQAVAEEHVLGAAQADALGAEAPRDLARRRGRSALVRTFSPRKLSAQPRTVSNAPASSSGVTTAAPRR